MFLTSSDASGENFKGVSSGLRLNDPDIMESERKINWHEVGCSLYGKSALNFKHIKSCASFIVRRLIVVESVVLHIENFSPR